MFTATWVAENGLDGPARGQDEEAVRLQYCAAGGTARVLPCAPITSPHVESAVCNPTLNPVDAVSDGLSSDTDSEREMQGKEWHSIA